MVDAGLIVIVAFISPFASRAPDGARAARGGRVLSRCSSTPRSPSPRRATRRASTRRRARGELKNFTGIDSPYEAPEQPELQLDTSALSPEEAAEAVVAFLEQRGMLP